MTDALNAAVQTLIVKMAYGIAMIASMSGRYYGKT